MAHTWKPVHNDNHNWEKCSVCGLYKLYDWYLHDGPVYFDNPGNTMAVLDNLSCDDRIIKDILE